MRPACRIQPSFTRSPSRWSRDILSFARFAMPFLPQSPAHAPQSVGELLEQRAAERPDQPALVFVADAGEAGGHEVTWTYADLDRRARAVAAEVSRRASPGDRAVLVFPPGLDFIAAYFGCLYAGVLPAPATYPKPRRPLARLDAIVADCAPKLALTTADTLRTMQLDQQAPAVRALTWIAADRCGDAPASFQPVERSASDPAFLQYTSGSTSQPRGVVVTHGNLLHNLELIRQGFGLPEVSAQQPGERPPTGVFWLPAYHDMGLIGGILSPLFVGGTTHLLAPATFLQRPMAWLETLSRTKAAVSGAPNFAYELCTRKSTEAERRALDLGHWRLAFCGAEPIDADGLDNFAGAFAPAGFRRDAFYPCYGLAEATLMVTGGAGSGAPRVVHADRGQLAAHKLVPAQAGPAAQKLVSCGRALGDQDVLVVDPESAKPQAAGVIGEIWVRGSSVAAGYWNHSEELRATFGARTADGRGPFLRTGDLGALLDGELFVAGRLKDLIIVRGRNLYPQDIERTVEQAHEAVENGAAFSVGDPGHEELVVVHQVSRERRKDDMNAVMRAIRAAIVEEHEVDPQAIVLLRPASLPMTSSGKVQRGRCREMYLAGELQELDRWTRPAETTAPAQAGGESVPPRPKFLDRIPSYSVKDLAAEIQQWMLGWLASRVDDGLGELTADSTFAEMGIDSLTALELNLEFEKVLGLRLPPGEAWSYPTPAALAQYLAKSLHNIATMGKGPDGNPVDSWFAAMDADVER
jgi:acyl-CoA synthetase (AMP-forming)/AMP-acid ligase II/acyl carrier protein